MSDPISITIENLSKKFDSIQALDGISLNFSGNIIHGIVGPAGAGKTTLLRIMLSLIKQNSGKVTYKVGGNEIEFSKIRTEIAYMPQQQSLYADLSIEEHMEFFANLYNISANEYEKLSKTLYEITRLGKFRDRPAGKLSGGMYKKLGLMCTLLRSPKIILLDEPTNGVDPISRREFWEILNDTAGNNVLVIMTTAYMDEAERCGCVHLMEKGKLLDSGEPQQLLKNENVANFDEFFIRHAEKQEKK